MIQAKVAMYDNSFKDAPKEGHVAYPRTPLPLHLRRDVKKKKTLIVVTVSTITASAIEGEFRPNIGR